MFQHLDKIAELCEIRRRKRTERNEAGNMRRQLADKIGPLMKSNRPEDAPLIDELKAEAEKAKNTFESAGKEFDAMFGVIDGLLNHFPNLLDDR